MVERIFTQSSWAGLENNEHRSEVFFASTAGSSSKRKAIIVASIQSEDTTWVQEAFREWDFHVYVADNRDADYTVFKGEGREAAVYLTYIITHYYDLPDYMVFMHAKRYQWHNDDPMYDGIPVVRNLQLSNIDKEGYVSLRCPHKPGCIPGLDTTSEEEDTIFTWHNAYKQAFADIFPGVAKPPKVAALCYSTFAVSKAAVLSRPPWAYEQYRQWHWTTDVGSGKARRIFEYMRHIIFWKPAVFCPPAQQCYCRTFGLCDLKCPNATKCDGRYEWPEKVLTGIPRGWPGKGQGQSGLPVDGWWEEWYPSSEYDDFHLRPNVTH